MTNPLTDGISEMIAETINGLSPGAGASSLRTSFAGLLAQLVNLLEGGSSASALRQSVPELIVRWAAAVGVSPAPSALTSDPLDMLAAIRNTLSDDPDIGSARTAVGELWEQALDLTLSDSGGGGGGDVPAWVQALQALAADPSDLVFAYNFASGGTGEGWDGVNGMTLTAAQAWEVPVFGSSWDPDKIIDGLGLEPDGDNIGATPVGLLPASVNGGATLLQVSKAYEAVTNLTFGNTNFQMADSPDDSTDGASHHQWTEMDGTNEVKFLDCEGVTSAQDDIDPMVAEVRSAYNFKIDGNDLAGSANGRSVVTGSGAVGANPVNTVYVLNGGGDTDTPIYMTLVAVFTLQLEANLPTMSAVA